MTKEKQKQKQSLKESKKLKLMAELLIDPETSDIYIDTNDVPLLDFIRAISLMDAYALREIATINEKEIPDAVILERLKSQFRVSVKNVE